MKIALVGSAPSSVGLAPCADPSWQIWACSPGAFGHVGRVDAWFELHRWEPDKPWFSAEYVAFMAGLECPVWMIEPVPEIPMSRAYPKAEILEMFGRNWFTSSLAWMLAGAIDQFERVDTYPPVSMEVGSVPQTRDPGPHEIALYGVDMSATEEYMGQKAGCLHFIELARAKGIRVTIPPESDLGQPYPLYGLGETNPMRIKLMARKAELETKLAEAVQQAEQHKTQWEERVRATLYFQGAIEDVQYMLNTWCE